MSKVKGHQFFPAAGGLSFIAFIRKAMNKKL
jgi:hypothetical protein